MIKLKKNIQKKKLIATVGIEPTTLALLAPRSNQTELYGYVIILRKFCYNNFIIYLVFNIYFAI